MSFDFTRLTSIVRAARRISVWRALLGAGALYGIGAVVALGAETTKKSFRIPAGNALSTLRQFSNQSGTPLLYSAQEVERITTAAVKGTMTAREALDRMLAGTNLVAVPDASSGTVTIHPAPKTKSSHLPGPSSPLTATDPRDRETAAIELSPFEVRSEQETGYQAASTTSGTRLAARLRDTPAAVSSFTSEFLSDFAATDIADILAYAINVESEFEDSNPGFNDRAGRTATGGDYDFRIRGLPAGATRDFVESSLPVDLYNIERAEIASGPNSILFGLGAAGGLLSLTGKRAVLARDRTTLESQWGSWHHERHVIDYNKVLIPQRLSVRWLGLYQNNEGWRQWDFHDQRRATTAITWQPFPRTTVYAAHEAGRTAQNVRMGWNATDGFSLWDQSGRPVAEARLVPGVGRINQNTDRFTFFEQDGAVYNLRGELLSASAFTGPTLLPPALSPYDYSLTGPGGIRAQGFNAAQVQIQQRLGRNLVLEFGWFHNENDIGVDAMAITGVLDLRGDPNRHLPSVDGSDTTIRNSRARQLFVETSWFKDRLVASNDVARLTAACDIDGGPWLGRHRLAGLLENSHQHRLKRWKDEILVAENSVPLSDPAIPESPRNLVVRRHYVVEGDFDTYYAGDSRIPVPGFTYQGRQVGSTYVARTKSNLRTRKAIDSFMLASQSFWFGERLVTTLGWRLDRIAFKNDDQSRITDPSDPRVVTRKIVLHEWDFDGRTTTDRYRPTTFTAGAVLHATQRLSLFYNTSRNNGAPRLDRTILPEGNVPPPTDGKGRDFGAMLDLLGDERFFLRAAIFDTAQLNDAPITPNGLGAETSGDLGGENLVNILGALLAAGKISPLDYDRQAISYNAATIDLFTRGFEVEFGANTRNLTLRLGYSYSDRRRDNFFKEVFAFYAGKIPEWRALAAGDADLLATIDREVALLDGHLAEQVAIQDSPFASRPHKANFALRYKFTEGPLRGTYIGGGARYQSRNFISRDRATGREYWGNETLFGDLFAGYRVRLKPPNRALTLQLNIKNFTDSHLVGIGRYNETYDGLRRVYLNEPRSYRLTATLEF